VNARELAEGAREVLTQFSDYPPCRKDANHPEWEVHDAFRRQSFDVRYHQIEVGNQLWVRPRSPKGFNQGAIVPESAVLAAGETVP